MIKKIRLLNWISQKADSSKPKGEVCPIPVERVREPTHFKTASIYWSATLNDVHWRDQSHSLGPDVTVHDESGQCLVSIPLQFLLTGKVSIIEYITEVIGFCYKESGSLHFSEDKSAAPEDPISDPQDLVFIRSDGSKDPCEALPGPHFRFPYGLFRNELHYDLINAEERPENWTEETNRLHADVRARLKKCLFTGNSHEESLMAFPIVPPPVDAKIQTIVRKTWDPVSFTESARFPTRLLERSVEDSKSSWLLLGPNEQVMWESGHLALWPHPTAEGGYIVHTFIAYEHTYLHGKVIPKKRFHGFDETLLQQLLGFHYQQCCMKMLRGYAAGPLPCSEEQLRWTYYDGQEDILEQHESIGGKDEAHKPTSVDGQHARWYHLRALRPKGPAKAKT